MKAKVVGMTFLFNGRDMKIKIYKTEKVENCPFDFFEVIHGDEIVRGEYPASSYSYDHEEAKTDFIISAMGALRKEYPVQLFAFALTRMKPKGVTIKA